MPVDYKLRTLRRLFGVRSMFLRPTIPNPGSMLGRKAEQDLADGIKSDAGAESASGESKPSKPKMKNIYKKTIWGTGGLPKAYFVGEAPRATLGKSVSGVLRAVNFYEKQKMRVYYGAIRDGQFLRYVGKAKKVKYNVDAQLMRLLEMRLDNLLYRTGFVQTPAQARQWIGHGKILVNNYKVDIRSAGLEPGDVITIRESFMEQALKSALQVVQMRKLLGCGVSWIPTSSNPVGMIPWMEVDRMGLSAAIVRYPFDDEVRILRNAALYPFVKNAELNPAAALRAYR